MMTDTERELLKLQHRMDMAEQDEQHSREENDQQHEALSGRIDSVTVRIDGHDELFVRQDERIVTLENKRTTDKARLVDGIVKWVFAFLGFAATAGGMFLLGSLFGGGK